MLPERADGGMDRAWGEEAELRELRDPEVARAGEEPEDTVHGGGCGEVRGRGCV